MGRAGPTDRPPLKFFITIQLAHFHTEVYPPLTCLRRHFSPFLKRMAFYVLFLALYGCVPCASATPTCSISLNFLPHARGIDMPRNHIA